MVVLKHVDVPQNVYILGCYFEDNEETGKEYTPQFRLTDDYCSIEVRNSKGEKLFSIETWGGGYIMTEEELRGAIPDASKEDSLSEDCVMLENFVGDILVRVLAVDENNVKPPFDLLNLGNWDIDEDLLYIDCPDDCDREVFLEVPYGFRLHRMLLSEAFIKCGNIEWLVGKDEYDMKRCLKNVPYKVVKHPKEGWEHIVNGSPPLHIDMKEGKLHIEIGEGRYFTEITKAYYV